MKQVRCAIYTRKSSEEGLEQGFNSLDAQREACAAYILSQASEGWTALPDIYDDGGISGGTLERPALQRLLADIAASRIDIIVVYKVDRLTRSLLDFSKLVEAFDKASVSFVSITQSFNTTTSMGRLTLNMLLSFAQFEREVTAERIRDKIAASKAKGMWMGGIPPLGYKPNGRSLTIVPEHAALVRHIFARYLALGNVRRLADELLRDGTTAPVRTLANGKPIGGQPLSRGQLYLMLKNPIYIGEIAHRDTTYPGQHAAIVDRGTWDHAQAKLAENLQGRRTGVYVRAASLLAGKVEDAEGHPLICDHASKPGSNGGKVRYRYYATRRGDAAELRIPARELEAAVIERVAQALGDPADLASAGWQLTPGDLRQLAVRAGQLGTMARDRPFMDRLVTRVRILSDRIAIDCATKAFAELLGFSAAAHETMTITSAARLSRSGAVLRLVQPGGRTVGDVPANSSLVRLLAQARDWNGRLRNDGADITSLANELGKTKSYVSRVVRLAYLAPDVVAAMLQGGQRAEVGSDTLTLPDAVPASWAEQRHVFLPG